MNPDHRRAIHEAINYAINHGTTVYVSFHPVGVHHEASILSRLSPVGEPTPQHGETRTWWTQDASSVHLTVHAAQDPDPGPAFTDLDLTQVDRTVPYVAEVTVATTQPDFAARLAASLKRNAAALEGLDKADDAGWDGYYRAGIE